MKAEFFSNKQRMMCRTLRNLGYVVVGPFVGKAIKLRVDHPPRRGWPEPRNKLLYVSVEGIQFLPRERT